MPASSPRVSVVIPVRNEARNLGHVLAGVPSDVHEVLVVDGHSSDETAAVAHAAGAPVRFMTQRESGKGDALDCGFRAARGEAIVMLDGDGSMDPGEIPRFMAALEEGADAVKGSRFVPGGGSDDITLTRRVGNRLFCALANLLYRTRYTDLCYGYLAFRAERLAELDVQCEGFEVEALISVQIAKHGLRWTEVGSFERPRRHGHSNLRPLRDGLRILGILLRERLPGPARHRLGRAAPRPGPRFRIPPPSRGVGPYPPRPPAAR
jgi:glycosyltransferase involved in cell wall biosynthesis